MRIIKSFRYAWNGFLVAVKESTNVRIHLTALAMVVCLGTYFQIAASEWCILVLVGGLVISLEIVNTSLENLTNLVTREQNPLAGKVKDLAAAAVLVASVTAVIIGILIFAKYFFQ